jgi:dolichol-phosphate mannosyltransferase
MTQTAVVIAAYNEADNIAEVVSQARRHGEVIVVDDASTDETATLARQAGAALVRHETNTHIKQAFVDGFRCALQTDAKYIVQMDAGLSHSTDEIPNLVGALSDADMAIGSRCVNGGRLINQPLRRRLLSWGGSLLVRRATGMKIRDLTSGFKAYRRSLLHGLDAEGVLDRLKARKFAFQFELSGHIHRRGYRIAEVPITYRATGSSLNHTVVVEALRIWLGLLWHNGMPRRKWTPTGAIRRN